MLGLYVSDHPLFGKEAALRRKVDQSIGDLEELADRSPVRVGGVVTGLARRFTKRGDQMASFRLEDLEGDIEVVLFPRTLAEHGHKLADDTIVVVSGRINKRDEDRVSVSCEDIEVLTGLEDGPAPTLTLRIPEVRLGPRELDQLREILPPTPGPRPWCSTSAARRSVSPTSSASTSTASCPRSACPSVTTPSSCDRHCVPRPRHELPAQLLAAPRLAPRRSHVPRGAVIADLTPIG